ncbi:MAG: T9SS type A sorting domain-containing protein [Tannerella sp.]|nr:T9SS type A sorting domain-containing protein [Tannerella sp.]
MEIIEGLGFEGDPFGHLPGIPTCSCGSIPVCCQVNGELLYLNPQYADCEGNLVANETIADLSPKPEIQSYGNRLTVKYDIGDSFDVEVYNMQGLKMLQRGNNHFETILSTSGLPQGVYVVRIRSGEHVFSEKFVK